MKFKTETGEYTTPKKGDYVLSADIKDEAMHNQIINLFAAAGCEELDSADFGGNDPDDWNWGCVLYTDAAMSGKPCATWSYSNSTKCNRRIIPCQQTLFEAACEAEDGTRFNVTGYFGEFKVDIEGNLLWMTGEENEFAPMSSLKTTDFEVIPSGPKKRDVPVTVLRLIGTLSIEVPDDTVDDCVNAFDLIGRLMQWEGAQIGKPGFNFYNDGTGSYFEQYPQKYEVTFKTPEQAEAAHKSE